MDPDRALHPVGPLEQALFDRRIILVSGSVDHERSGLIAASLMTLDALGDDPVELRLNAGSDSLDVAFALIDTIDALGVYINATVAGVVSGTMVGVLAVCPHRRIGRLGSVSLHEPRYDYSGSATEIALQAADLERRLLRYLRRLSGASGRPIEHLEADIRMGRRLDATEALAYGLVDEILTR